MSPFAGNINIVETLYNQIMDIRAGIIAFAFLVVIGALFSLRAGIRTIQFSRKMTFYRLRRARAANGWRMIGFGLLLLIFAAWLPFYAPPLAYQYFPPSPTPTLTPTITITPTITFTPTITEPPTLTSTPLFTDTPTASPTPFLPLGIEAQITSIVTPNPEAVFSEIKFTQFGGGYPVIDPQTVFQNPVGHLWGVFSYDSMIPGVQWTALWLRDGKLVGYETKPWDGATGGSGWAEWNPAPEEWQPGAYEVQIFVGLDWRGGGRFIVQGDPPTPIPSMTTSPTRSPTATQTLVLTPTLVPPLPSASATQTKITTTGTP
jgi:hypothetical protein